MTVTTAEQALLTSLVAYWGGNSIVAASLEINVYAPSNWKRKGYVPTYLAERVADLWKIDPRVLAYDTLPSMWQETETPPWEDLVRQIAYLPPAIQDRILSYPRKSGRAYVAVPPEHRQNKKDAVPKRVARETSHPDPDGVADILKALGG